MKPVLIGPIILTLAACGGSSTTIVTTNDPQITGDLPDAPAGAVLSDSGTFQSDIVALGFIRRLAREGDTNVFADDQEVAGRFTGTYNHQTGEFNITALGKTLVTQEAEIVFQGRDTSGYDFVTVATPFLSIPGDETSASDARLSASLVLGIATPASAMPSDGTAAMTGDSRFGYANDDVSTSTRGNATLTVDFAAGTADLNLTAETAEVGDLNIVTVADMTITDTRFTGGTLSLLEEITTTSTVIGTIADSTVEGQFFGQNATNSAPAEAGGTIRATGTDGSFSAEFLAK